MIVEFPYKLAKNIDSLTSKQLKGEHHKFCNIHYIKSSFLNKLRSGFDYVTGS